MATLISSFRAALCGKPSCWAAGCAHKYLTHCVLDCDRWQGPYSKEQGNSRRPVLSCCGFRFIATPVMMQPTSELVMRQASARTPATHGSSSIGMLLHAVSFALEAATSPPGPGFQQAPAIRAVFRAQTLDLLTNALLARGTQTKDIPPIAECIAGLLQLVHRFPADALPDLQRLEVGEGCRRHAIHNAARCQVLTPCQCDVVRNRGAVATSSP